MAALKHALPIPSIPEACIAFPSSIRTCLFCRSPLNRTSQTAESLYASVRRAQHILMPEAGHRQLMQQPIHYTQTAIGPFPRREPNSDSTINRPHAPDPSELWTLASLSTLQDSLKCLKSSSGNLLGMFQAHKDPIVGAFGGIWRVRTIFTYNREGSYVDRRPHLTKA